jgi:Cu(I)/Ag(I) efflux system membrane protein CusA/SilA
MMPLWTLKIYLSDYGRTDRNRRNYKKTVLNVVFEASKEVRMPILYSTFIIIASFVPLFFLSGMEGRMLAPLGVPLYMALIASTVVALTLTPVLCSYLLGKPRKDVNRNVNRILVRKLENRLRGSLKWTLKYKKWVLGGTGVVLVIAVINFHYH